MTLVVDVTVVAELLLGTGPGAVVADEVGGADLVAPSHLAAEVLSVLRGWTLGGHMAPARAELAIREFRELGVRQIPVDDLLESAFALRHNVSAYDALYVALARALDCELLTLDARLVAAAPDVARLPAPDLEA